MQAAADTRRECWKCRAERGAALVCPRCAAIQPLSADADLFTVLDLPRQLTLDIALPFGVKNREQIQITPIDANSCRTTFN